MPDTAGSCAGDLGRLALQFDHRRVGDIGRGLRAALDEAGVVLRDETLSAPLCRERPSFATHRENDDDRQRPMMQHGLQRPAVKADDGGERSLDDAAEQAGPCIRFMCPQPVPADHRRQRQRYDGGNDDGEAKRQREGLEEPPDDAAEEEQRE